MDPIFSRHLRPCTRSKDPLGNRFFLTLTTSLPQRPDISSLVDAIMSERREELTVRAINNIVNLLTHQPYGAPAQAGWTISPGSVLSKRYLAVFRDELRARLSSQNGFIAAFGRLSPDALTGLSLLSAEQERLSALKERLGAVSARAANNSRTATALDLSDDQISKEDIVLAAEVLAHQRALREVRNWTGELTAAVQATTHTRVSFAAREQRCEHGRMIFRSPYRQLPVMLEHRWLDSCDLPCLPSTDRSASSDIPLRAAKVADYLVRVTRTHTADAQIDSTAHEALRRKIFKELQGGKGLSFSVYLSLEKFPAPRDTASSVPDLGEARMVSELKTFIDTVQTLSGTYPSIIIMNESAANRAFTNAAVESYSARFRALLRTLGLEERVKIVDFDRDLFVAHLQRNGRSAADAAKFFDDSFQLLRDLYADIFSNQLPQGARAAIDQHIKQRYPHYSSEISGGVAAFVERNFDTIRVEVTQSVNTERNGAVDPSLLMPSMPHELLSEALGAGNSSPSSAAAIGAFRRLMLMQAQLQGPFFKALMRMRYLVQEAAGAGPLLPAEVIPISITNAPNKLSISLGRSARSGVTLNGQEIRGVSPQHGVGVVAQGRIVSIPWHCILQNSGEFHPATLQIGHTRLPGFVRTMRALVIDLDYFSNESRSKFQGGPQIELYPLIGDALRAGIPCGLIGCRDDATSQERVRNGLIGHLKRCGYEPSAPEYQSFFTSAADHTYTQVGLSDPKPLQHGDHDLTSKPLPHLLSLARAAQRPISAEVVMWLGASDMRKKQQSDGERYTVGDPAKLGLHDTIKFARAMLNLTQDCNSTGGVQNADVREKRS